MKKIIPVVILGFFIITLTIVITLIFRKKNHSNGWECINSICQNTKCNPNNTKCYKDKKTCDLDCNKSYGICSPDYQNGSCPQGQTCQNGKCVSCGTCSSTCMNGTCPDGQTCQNGRCTQCTCSSTCMNGTCPDGQTCQNGRCAECTCSSTCPNGICFFGAGQEICENGICTQCTCSSSCQNGICPSLGQICQNGKCVSCGTCSSSCPNGTCSSPGQICQNGKCVSCDACSPTCPNGTCLSEKQTCQNGICFPVNCPQGSIVTLDKINSINSGNYNITTVINGYTLGLNSVGTDSNLIAVELKSNCLDKVIWNYDSKGMLLTTKDRETGNILSLQTNDGKNENCSGSVGVRNIEDAIGGNFILTTSNHIYSVQNQKYLKFDVSQCSSLSYINDCYCCSEIIYTDSPDDAIIWKFTNVN